MIDREFRSDLQSLREHSIEGEVCGVRGIAKGMVNRGGKFFHRLLGHRKGEEFTEVTLLFI